MMFEIGKLRFLDSFQFLPSSLEKLVEALRGVKGAGESKFVRTIKHFPDTKLIFGKGVYPYGYMTSRDVLPKPNYRQSTIFTTHSPKSAYQMKITNVHKIRGTTLKFKTCSSTTIITWLWMFCFSRTFSKIFGARFTIYIIGLSTLLYASFSVFGCCSKIYQSAGRNVD